jgi:hypothetical protein
MPDLAARRAKGESNKRFVSMSRLSNSGVVVQFEMAPASRACLHRPDAGATSSNCITTQFSFAIQTALFYPRIVSYSQ